MNRNPSQPPLAVTAGAAIFLITSATLSWWHWWTFQYRSFDLAFYVQAFWLALRGQWHVSLLDVPLMGNHAEPIVALFLPIFALIPHPMTLVVLQALALATMPFTAWSIARRKGLDRLTGGCLALLLVVIPATGFIAIHEFHPEALAAPLLLLLIEARVAQRLRRYWLWFGLALACKENIALLLIAWCVVHAWLDRRRSFSEQCRWNAVPMLVAAGWLFLYGAWISPWLNGGRVDYLELYSHLGRTPMEIVMNFFVEPQRAASALWRAITHGNMVWSLLLCFLGLPLLRPQWLLICAPILLQHLLSSRSSEWTVYFHYAAPLLPLLWIASAEAVANSRRPHFIAAALLLASSALQIWDGPSRQIVTAWTTLEERLWDRTWKAEMLARVPDDPNVSVAAGIPYLSHLAMRHDLHSLHFVIKGLKTLSLQRYEPVQAVDVVVVDFGDAATFDKRAAFLHPASIPGAPQPLPSSDQLLHDFLARHSWETTSLNSMTIFQKAAAPQPASLVPGDWADSEIGLRQVQLVQPPGRPAAINMDFEFAQPRSKLVWSALRVENAAASHVVRFGLCAPHVHLGSVREHRPFILPSRLPGGTYRVSVVFYDHITALWEPENLSRFERIYSLGEMRLPERE